MEYSKLKETVRGVPLLFEEKKCKIELYDILILHLLGDAGEGAEDEVHVIFIWKLKWQ